MRLTVYVISWEARDEGNAASRCFSFVNLCSSISLLSFAAPAGALSYPTVSSRSYYFELDEDLAPLKDREYTAGQHEVLQCEADLSLVRRNLP